MKETEIKKLILNGIELAQYTIDNDILFLNVTKLEPFNEIIPEQILFNLIGIVEKKPLKGLAYLNLEGN